MDELEQLRSVMPPPGKPAPIEVSWEEAEEELGVQFSPSCKALIETYGAGRIGDELLLRDPRRLSGFLHFMGLRKEAFALTLSPDYYLPSYLDPLLPLSPGPGARLLPLAGNGNGSDLYARVEDGVMRDDRVWIVNLRDDEWIEYPVSAVTMLLRTVTGGWDIVVEKWGNVWDLRPEFEQPPSLVQ